MNKARKKIVIIAICASIILVSIVIGSIYVLNNFGELSNARDNRDPQTQKEMLSITLDWGRFASLPDSKKQFQISTEGSPFTRAFRSSFYLEKGDLDNWIKDSPGLQDAEIETINDTTKKFIIKPGDGACYAEAVIDFDKCFVTTYVYWS